jgi:hypothetical protein
MMGGQLICGQPNLKNPEIVYITLQACRHALYTETEFIRDFAANVTVTGVYRWMRLNGRKRPLALHTDDQAGFTRTLDELADDLRKGRLSITLAVDLPPVPANPDQKIIDLLTLLDAMPMS